MEWKKESAEKGLVKIPYRWVLLHYYEAFNLLFRVENALRVFVYCVLKKELHEKWTELSIKSDESQQGTIKSIAKKRINQAQKFGYLGYAINCPIMHLTSGELIGLIFTDSYWDEYFKAYFLGSKEIIHNKLNEIGAIRNSLAHFRPLTEDEVETIKHNAKHALPLIEKCLNQLVNINFLIPSNTEEEWYKQLKTIGTDICRLQFYQCKDKQWIKIQLIYSSAIINRSQYSQTYKQLTALKLVSPAILNKYPELANLLIYLSEEVPYAHYYGEEDPGFKKVLSFVFSEKILLEKYEVIKSSLEKLFLKISEESELIKEDNLARGEIIEVAPAFLEYKEPKEYKAYWSANQDSFLCPVSESDPPEYWGYIQRYISDFVAGIEKYPWMPTRISYTEAPF